MQARLYDASWELLASGCQFTPEGPVTRAGTSFRLELPAELELASSLLNVPIFIETPSYRCEGRIQKVVGPTVWGLVVPID